MKLFRQLAAIPRLLVAIAILKSDVQLSFHDTDVLAAWQRFKCDPAIANLVPRISAEWRSVEEAVESLK